MSYGNGKKASQSRVLAINPKASELGSKNAILTGTSKTHYVPDFEGCLSLKTVVSGSAVWEAAGRRFVVHENSYLILNDRQHYSMTIDSARPSTTFCIFFQRGFLEDIFFATVTPDTLLLDAAPSDKQYGRLGFLERLETNERVLRQTENLRTLLFSQDCAPAVETIEQRLYEIAALLLAEHQNTDAAIARLPSVRASTRSELYRRLLRGRDYLLSSLDSTVLLKDVAQAAHLSPYHFHRLFASAFGDTPQRYLSRHRLDKAAALLTRSSRGVTEISFECGFESPASFSLAFRRRFGSSPRDFRRAAQKKAI